MLGDADKVIEKKEIALRHDAFWQQIEGQGIVIIKKHLFSFTTSLNIKKDELPQGIPVLTTDQWTELREVGYKYPSRDDQTIINTKENPIEHDVFLLQRPNGEYIAYFNLEDGPRIVDVEIDS